MISPTHFGLSSGATAKRFMFDVSFRTAVQFIQHSMLTIQGKTIHFPRHDPMQTSAARKACVTINAANSLAKDLTSRFNLTEQWSFRTEVTDQS